jgi:hypothetical protein
VTKPSWTDVYVRYNHSDTIHETLVYHPDGEWYHSKTYSNRGDQLIDAAKLMDEGYDFDGKGEKVKPHHIETLRKEVFTHEVPKEASGSPSSS